MSLRSHLLIVLFESSVFLLDFFFFLLNLLIIKNCVFKSHTMMKNDQFFSCNTVNFCFIYCEAVK